MHMAETPSFMAGIPELMLLRLLRDREMYGYEIVQAIALRSRQVVTPGEGVVYPLLHGLEKAGALKSRRKTVSGRNRVYYSLTARGEKRLAALADHWTALNGAVESVLGANAHAV
jgi:PadR family transcriptional regulator PadR